MSPAPSEFLPTEAEDLARRLGQCEVVLDHRFANRALLELALTHSSAARTRPESNERLEFLGDAILGAVVCEMLFARFPQSPEGELTRIKSILVSRTTCAQLSRRLGFERFLLVGKGIGGSDRIPMSILGAVFEAIVAAIYLDAGYDAARRFIERAIVAEVDRAAARDRGKNFKSQLQHLAQIRFGATPAYRVLDEQGPDHLKCFRVAAVVAEVEYPGAWGPSKKEAEQAAARQALATFDAEPAGEEE